MKRIHTKEDLLLILNYARAINFINSHCYKSVRNTHIVYLARFLRNIGMIDKIITHEEK